MKQPQRFPKDDRPLVGPGQSPGLPKPGDYRIRTDDPLLAKQVLYQLS
jgi:hypothetical protein